MLHLGSLGSFVRQLIRPCCFATTLYFDEIGFLLKEKRMAVFVLSSHKDILPCDRSPLCRFMSILERPARLHPTTA